MKEFSMMPSCVDIALSTERFRPSLGKRLSLLLLGLTLLFSTALWAQREAGPDVVYAVAPEWPALSAVKAQQPQKEVVLVKVEMDGFGNVVDTKLLTPNSTYSNSAVQAAQLWKFSGPAGTGPDFNIKGMTATLKFTFELRPRNTSRYELGTAFIPPYEISLSRWVAQRH
jgi:hypothetical protein